MRKRRYSCFMIIILTNLVFPTIGNAVGEDLHATIDRIIEEGQLRDGELVEKFVALGQDAAPILAEELWTDETPGALLQALAQLADPRTTEPLIKYLYAHEPLSATLGEYSAEKNMTLRTLKEIGDPRAEEPLLKIVRSQSTLIETRLLAAAAVARFGTPAAKKECETFIMDIWHRSRPLNSDFPEPFYNTMAIESMLHEAVPEVDTPEAAVLTHEWLNDNDMPLLQKEIIAVFAKKQHPEMIDALKRLCTDSTQYGSVRFSCIKHLRKTGKVPEATIATYVQQLLQEPLEKEGPNLRPKVERLRQKLLPESSSK